ncbi:hypothetical protein Pint_22021 [Pistacia integerrima]|uniref:Uncharacterized protein n=1 Tax=Pistacia integerrima TaxID=434235 RepID=A0ACC0YIK6_9ROSI|nr:hypothetical protein Pint_22021 [Pistacia integerrima]
MVENGKFVLEKLIASCNGKCNPICSFSIEELKQATNDYDRQKMITKGGGYELYKGDFHCQDRLISVLKFQDYWANELDFNSWLNNIVFPSQMNHKIILKLIGSCLETHLPILVFEYVKHGTFHDQSDNSFQLTHRLKIIMEIANAVAYLHLGFSRPILFKDINSSHILFDEYYVPKLFNFSVSKFIPEGETHITNRVRGTSGHVAPESLHTGYFNEKSDVYSFGLLLFEVLTGQRAIDLLRLMNWDLHSLRDQVRIRIENNKFNEILNLVIVRAGSCPGEDQHLQALVELAFKCLSNSAEDRPTMIQVAKTTLANVSIQLIIS